MLASSSTASTPTALASAAPSAASQAALKTSAPASSKGSGAANVTPSSGANGGTASRDMGGKGGSHTSSVGTKTAPYGSKPTTASGADAKGSMQQSGARPTAPGTARRAAIPSLPSASSSQSFSAAPRPSALTALGAPRPLPFFKVSSGMASQPVASSSRDDSSTAPANKGANKAGGAKKPRQSTTTQQSGSLPQSLTSNDLITSKAKAGSSPKGRQQRADVQDDSTKQSSSSTKLPLNGRKGEAGQSLPGSAGQNKGSKKVASEDGEDASPPSPESSSPQPSGQSVKKGQRRRKANRACSHCQKAHLTCDDSRPCERCVKKGLADTCTDGARKKAKYLLDEEELLELKREKDRKERAESNDIGDMSLGMSSGAPEPMPAQAATSMDPASQNWPVSATDAGGMMVHVMPSSQSAQQPLPPSYAPNNAAPSSAVLPPHMDASSVTSGTDGTPGQYPHGDNDMYAPFSSFSPASSNGLRHAFGSESASLEYSILSSMLNGIDPSWLSGSPDAQRTERDVTRLLGVSDLAQGQQQNDSDGIGWTLPDASQQQQTDLLDVSPWLNIATPGQIDTSSAQQPQQETENLPHLHLAYNAPSSTADGVAAYDALEVPSPGDSHGGIDRAGAGKAPRIAIEGTEQSAQTSKALAAAAAAGLDHKPDALWKSRVRHVYGDRTRPFPYTQGYHFLIKYVTANLDKADVLRLIRALAIFRPSLIALQMPLTEDDEVFVERSIQRTILEFEKLIGFSGTPTVVWRRTCEIVVVGAEFSMLTQWSRDHLRGRYIYEFFEKPSILDYWETFAAHAFENTAQSIMMPITLKTSSGSTTRCAACISIKRDMFDLPSLIVGNFLPILS